MFSTMACNADTGVTQLVAHIGYHVPSHLVGMLQFLRHLIERQSQLSDFVAAVGIDMHPDGVVAVRHSFRGIPHPRRGEVSPLEKK